MSKYKNNGSIIKTSLIFKIFEGFKYIIKLTVKWFTRFDKAHKDEPYAVIKRNSKFTGVKDPHIKLPPGAVTTARCVALFRKVEVCLCYITLVADSIQLGNAIYKDLKNGSWDNTLEFVFSKTGQYIGGILGTLVGNIIGSLLIPGIGPMIGAFAIGFLGIKYGGDVASNLYKKYRLKPKALRNF